MSHYTRSVCFNETKCASKEALIHKRPTILARVNYHHLNRNPVREQFYREALIHIDQRLLDFRRKERLASAC